MNNPDWDRKIFEKHCHGVAQYADKYDLPMPVTDDEEMLFPGCDLGEYLGEGHFGTVYPTESKGIVFKITSDESEAHFIQTAINLRDKNVDPEGMVQYYAVIATNSRRAKRGKVFAIWREEAVKIGINYSQRDENGLDYLLQVTRQVAGKIFHHVKKKVRSMGRSTEYWSWLAREAHGETKFSELLHEYLDMCRVIKNDSLTAYYIGDAMESYYDAGIVMADIHANNVGWVLRDGKKRFVITDPGLIVNLRESLAETKIEVVK